MNAWRSDRGHCDSGSGKLSAEARASIAQILGAIDKVVPADLHVCGCPPGPIDLLRGLGALAERAAAKSGA
jgi:Ni,Fe-hydrogenase III small subunit